MAGPLSGPIPAQLAGVNVGAGGGRWQLTSSGRMRRADQSFIFLGQATQPANILEYRYPLGVDGGVATAKLLLPKIIIFGIPQSRDFRRSNFAVAKPTMPTASKKSGGGQRGIQLNFTNPYPLLDKYLLAQCIKLRDIEKLIMTILYLLIKKQYITQNINSLVYTKLQFVKLQ